MGEAGGTAGGGGTKVGINGLGRIGRMFLKRSREIGLDVVAVNDLAPLDQLVYLMRYDSAHGRWPGTVAAEGGALVLDGHRIDVSSEKDPARLGWRDRGVGTVVDSTGVFRDRAGVDGHFKAGAR